MRQIAYYPESAIPDCKARMLHFVSNQAQGVFFDSNAHAHASRTEWDAMAATGLERSVQASAGTAFDQLKSLQEETQDWLFGFLAYDLKNETERLQSELPDGIGMPDLYFFQPTIVLRLKAGLLEISTLKDSPDAVCESLCRLQLPENVHNQQPSIELTPRMAKEDYLHAVNQVKSHIMEGDVYEMNLCQEFYAEHVRVPPPHLFQRLNAKAGSPFAAYFRLDDKYLLSASPERFVQKRGRQLLSQPIKGTRKRSKNLEEDAALVMELQHSEKDRAENVMIVDLVRNDLARCCESGSIQVNELFKIYSFETVHQLISSVTGTLRENLLPSDALRALFPMGSMTGAPKVMAMQLIEQYEKNKRGLYSGAVGYISPDGDFDFNVVIRSILYNHSREYVSCSVGGAIVYDSNAEEEYAECMVKLKAMREVLLGDL